MLAPIAKERRCAEGLCVKTMLYARRINACVGVKRSRESQELRKQLMPRTARPQRRPEEEDAVEQMMLR